MRKNYWKSNLLIISSHLTLFLFRSLSWWMATPPATTNWAGIPRHPMPSLSLFPSPNRFGPYLLKSSNSLTLTRIAVALCPLGSWVGSHIHLLIPSWSHLLYMSWATPSLNASMAHGSRGRKIGIQVLEASPSLTWLYLSQDTAVTLQCLGSLHSDSVPGWLWHNHQIM